MGDILSLRTIAESRWRGKFAVLWFMVIWFPQFVLRYNVLMVINDFLLEFMGDAQQTDTD